MERPPPLNLIKFGEEWIVTNGVLAADGRIHFPENDPAEESFVESASPRADVQPGQSATTPTES